MRVEVRIGAVQEVEADAVVVNLFEGVTTPGGATAAVDRALEGRISRVLAAGDFRGRLGETLVLYTDGRIPAPRVILVGLGPEASFIDLGFFKVTITTPSRYIGSRKATRQSPLPFVPAKR
jgi:leucyl aminopeptidase